MCVYMLGKFPDDWTMSGTEYKLCLSCAVHTCVTDCTWGEKGYVIIMSLEKSFRAHELCESRGGRPGLLSLISLRFLWT